MQKNIIMSSNSLKAFVSYSSAQAAFAKAMISDIGNDLVTFDQYSFEAGDKITDSIRKGIEGCDIFILLISNDALNSDWVKEEIDFVAPLITTKGIDFRPYQIDDMVKANDSRLDKWVWQYLVKSYQYPKLLARTIQRVIREKIWKNYPNIKEQENVFVGRNKDMDVFENKYYRQDHARLKVIFVSGFPYVGRKTFLSRFIHNYVKTVFDIINPIDIIMKDNDSIDQFVLKLNDHIGMYGTDELIHNFANGGKSSLKYGVDVLCQLISYNEKIIVDDDACIVKPGGRIVDWFMDLIRTADLPNEVVLYVASRYKPANGYSNNAALMSYSISTLRKDEMYNLFKQCLIIYGMHLDENDINSFMECFSGYPIQAIDTARHLSENDLITTKKYANSLKSRFDGNYTAVLNKLSEKARDLIILLSQSDEYSCDLLQEIYGEEDITPILEELNGYSLYETSGQSKQLISLSSPLSDYISRQRMTLSAELNKRKKQSICRILKDTPKELTDISEVLLNIKENILQNIKTNDDRYLIPSYVLKVIVEQYHAEQDGVVKELADKIINNYNKKIYDSCLRPIHYWYCCALARMQNRDVFDRQIEFFADNERDYYYLKGFYFRHSGKKVKMQEAQNYYETALLSNRDYSLTSTAKIDHELVIVYMKLGKYGLAKEKAKSNYDNNQENTYHIRAYFNCLINTQSADFDELKSLIAAMRNTHDRGVDVFVPTMEAQLQYYIDQNWQKAIQTFRQILSTNRKFGRRYAIDAFRNICLQRERGSMNIFNSIVKDTEEKKLLDEDGWTTYEAF